MNLAVPRRGENPGKEIQFRKEEKTGGGKSIARSGTSGATRRKENRKRAGRGTGMGGSGWRGRLFCHLRLG